MSESLNMKYAIKLEFVQQITHQKKQKQRQYATNTCLSQKDQQLPQHIAVTIPTDYVISTQAYQQQTYQQQEYQQQEHLVDNIDTYINMGKENDIYYDNIHSKELFKTDTFIEQNPV